MTVTILKGDCIEKMKTMPDNSVDCVVTSPPYWGLRDYGVEGQIGLEPTLQEHLDKMIEVFREVWRVLKPTGTLWLNYGDCYASAPNGRKADDIVNDDRKFRDKPISTVGPVNDYGRRGSKDAAFPRGVGARRGGGNNPASGVLKPKDLCMIPNRLAIALQEDGWWVRSEIIWAKPNPMPESIKDRPATSHEKIFLLTKSAKYFYDHEAVRVKPKESSIQRLSQNIDEQAGSSRANGGAKTNGKMKAVGCGRKDKQRGHSRRHAGFNDRWDQMSKEEQQANGANLKNVWEIPTKGFKKAHFATFPPELAERCIKAGCPQGGVVFDPFGGAGTTGLVADQLQRDAILIELNDEYTDIAKRRIEGDNPMFAEVTVK